MNFEMISSILEGTPYMSPARARGLYESIKVRRPLECLELGFAHGTSSCYIAAALEEIGKGHLTSVDLAAAKFAPPIEELLDKTGLGHRVTVAREQTSYNWFLKKKIEERSRAGGACEPLYDFCFIDGSKHWTTDGFAFFLVDKLLRPGGWILFDDFTWTHGEYEHRTGKKATDGISHREMGQDERETPHVKLIVQLLVMQHPEYGEFRIQDDSWAWAQKVRSNPKVVRIETRTSFKAKLVTAFRAVRAAARTR